RMCARQWNWLATGSRSLSIEAAIERGKTGTPCAGHLRLTLPGMCGCSSTAPTHGCVPLRIAVGDGSRHGVRAMPVSAGCRRTLHCDRNIKPCGVRDPVSFHRYCGGSVIEYCCPMDTLVCTCAGRA